MLSRILTRSLSLNKSLTRTTAPFYRFSETFKQQRRNEKEKEGQLIQQISELETVAQQDQFTEKQLNAIISERKEQLKSIIAEKKIPIDALLLGLSVTLPLLGGTGYLYYQLAQGLATESFLPFFNTMVKVIGVHQCFQSGVHWGLAVQQHDLQVDAVNSSPQARYQFLLSCLPVAAALANTISIVYGVPTEGILNLAPIAIMAGTQIFILGLDAKAVQEESAPKWYMNFKIWLSLLCFTSYGLFAAMFMNYGSEIKEMKKNTTDPFRKYIPSQKELLLK